jgi:hypothetical protein
MRVTATRIRQWAETREGQGLLPELVRKLIHATGGRLAYIDVPAGDSVVQPGWDGEVEFDGQSPWVPEGKSFWELSCEAQAARKANREYQKRTEQTPQDVRENATFVFVTARQWTTKKVWIQKKREAKKWKEIRGYDASDLEQWLEQVPAVALWFAETLGITGPGVESLEQYWRTWSQQSSPSISPEALFAGRENSREQLIQQLRKRLEEGHGDLLKIQADSVEEAVAFVCVVIQQDENLRSVGLVVTEPKGWRFVDANPAIKVVVAARPEVAERPAVRRGLVIVIPCASGDMAVHYRGAAGRQPGTGLVLERPRRGDFEKALVKLGLDEAEAQRLSESTGRSWSVFRRRRSINPAIRKPRWMEMLEARALATVCLLGAWKNDNPEDRAIVSRLAGRSYEEVERELRNLAQVDDAPVLQIGSVWKAKSPLELLDLFGERITSGELERFFEVAWEILAAPDPVLDLPEEKRYAARIYSKMRPQSEILISALCDTLIKLAVRGPILPSLLALNIEERVANLVHNLLHDADKVRWLSLSSLLPALAEAAPEAFLEAVEHSLNKPNQPVTSLLRETGDSALFGKCWHAGLLWALETLAWSPRFLGRVALILAQLAHIEIKGNWGDTPFNSLVDIFRPWLPQTGVSLEERIRILDLLVEKDPDIAFDLLDRLAYIGPDTAFPTARPKWRDYDTGAGRGIPQQEIFRMVHAAVDRMIVLAKGNPGRVARLIQKANVFDKKRRKAIFDLAAEFISSGTDEAREVVRAGLRKTIHWPRNNDKSPESAVAENLKPLEDLYEALTPQDPIIRYRWLFAESVPKIPTLLREDYTTMVQYLASERMHALQEIYNQLGMDGVERLAATCPGEPWVGTNLAKLDLLTGTLAEWILRKSDDFTENDPLTVTIRGLLRSLLLDLATELIRRVLQASKKQHWPPERIARFLTLARPEKATWQIVSSCGSEVEKSYWVQVPLFCLREDEEDLGIPLRRLLEAGRPRTAFQVCRLVLDKTDPCLIADILEQMVHAKESNGPHPDPSDIAQAIERLEASRGIDNSRLVRIEFLALPLLGYGNEHRAETLYATLMSDPSLFCEAICIAFRPKHGDVSKSVNESGNFAAEIAFRLLNKCHILPGTRPDGRIDETFFLSFIDDVRNLCKEKDRLEVCDIILGQILANAPKGDDNIWPFELARAILDRSHADDIRHGFILGAINRRGVTYRSPSEGGRQERELAEEYRAYADGLRNRYPQLAATLDEIARAYEGQGRVEDIEATLYVEGLD